MEQLKDKYGLNNHEKTARMTLVSDCIVRPEARGDEKNMRSC